MHNSKQFAHRLHDQSQGGYRTYSVLLQLSYRRLGKRVSVDFRKGRLASTDKVIQHFDKELRMSVQTHLLLNLKVP